MTGNPRSPRGGASQAATPQFHASAIGSGDGCNDLLERSCAHDATGGGFPSSFKAYGRPLEGFSQRHRGDTVAVRAIVIPRIAGLRA
jgi:hypothetical protein